MRPYLLVGLGLFVVVVVWAGTICVLPMWIPDVPTRGQVGDSFGAANALFTGLAFVFAAGAFWLQHHEIKSGEAIEAERREADTRRLEIAERTAVLQKAMLVIQERQVVSKELHEIRHDAMRYRDAVKNYLPYCTHGWPAAPTQARDVAYKVTSEFEESARVFVAHQVAIAMLTSHSDRLFKAIASLHTIIDGFIKSKRGQNLTSGDEQSLESKMAEALNRLSAHLGLIIGEFPAACQRVSVAG